MKTTLVLIGVTAMAFGSLAAAELTRYPGGGERGDEVAAVRVQRGSLIHTRQYLCRGEDAKEVRRMFEEMIAGVRDHGGDVSTVAKLNLYVSDAEAAVVVRGVIAEMWKPVDRPAVTLIPSELPGGSGAACDAVAVGDESGEGVMVGKNAAVAPAGRDLLYVSGRAASGDLAEATRGTMEQLFSVLAMFGSGPGDVVQVRAFLQPMEQVAVVENEIAKVFPEGKVPPVIYVAWTSKSRATEIEVIAAAPDGEKTEETVSFSTPPGEKASPVFSRVARVHAAELIFIGGIAAEPGTPEAQVTGIFDRLDAIAREAGSDLRHLVKATYYVSTDEAGAALNAIRPALYDPERPPAASKIAVPGLEVAGGEVLIDMMAVPVGPGS